MFIAPSAKKRFSEAAIEHALRNRLWTWPPDDEGLVMVVGAANSAGVRLLEVGYVESDDGVLVVVHAMKCRPKYMPPGW